MKTTLDLVDVVWQLLNSSSLKGEITGGVYKLKRPLNSAKEDVVVNSLPVSNEQLQTAIVNVNVFVIDLEVGIEGEKNTMPDIARLKQLAAMTVDILQDGIDGDYTWDVQQQTVIEDEGNDQHFVNIRLEFFISNI